MSRELLIHKQWPIGRKWTHCCGLWSMQWSCPFASNTVAVLTYRGHSSSNVIIKGLTYYICLTVILFDTVARHWEKEGANSFKNPGFWKNALLSIFLPSPTSSICLSPQVSFILFSKNLSSPHFSRNRAYRQRTSLKLPSNSRTCCKMSTYWSTGLQWSAQSSPICLLQASLNWNSPTVCPWSPH